MDKPLMRVETREAAEQYAAKFSMERGEIVSAMYAGHLYEVRRAHSNHESTFASFYLGQRIKD